MRRNPYLINVLMVLGSTAPASAHVSEQGFVLLLPTGLYSAAGVATVVLTIVVLAVVPGSVVLRLFRPFPLWRRPPGWTIGVAQALALAVFAALVWIGLTGPRDPLANALPLAVWTIWWIALVSVQGVVGNVWRWVTPFAVPLVLFDRPLLRTYPHRWGHAPAIVLFLCFAAFVLADPAPADPGRLARIAAGYWLFTLLAGAAFGRRWLVRGEVFTVLMHTYGRASAFGSLGQRVHIGLPSWKIATGRTCGPGAGLFAILLLGTGSFDGLNETFWWLALIGINPLEFPGRSAVIGSTIAGLIATNVLLVAAFVVCLWLGLRLSRQRLDLRSAFTIFAPSLLPIALGYHVAHYLTAFLVDVQYALAAATDPFARGDDLLGLGRFYVTTGFFNTEATVRVIWLSQAGAVVIGHVLAILLADALAVRTFPSRRSALLSQLPLALFMIGYTLFGLWLLASPRGL